MSGCSWRPHLKLKTKEDDQNYIFGLILLQNLLDQRKLQLCQVFQVTDLWKIKSSFEKMTISIS